MELVEEKWLHVDTASATMEKTLGQARHDEAEPVSASQSIYKGCNPARSSRIEDLGHQVQGELERTEKISTITKADSCNTSISGLHDPERKPASPRPRQLTLIWIPYLAVATPNLVLPGVLLGLVLGFKVDKGKDLFAVENGIAKEHQGYYLVAYSVTRLAIISSCVSTMAPFFTAPILLLWRIHTIRNTYKVLNYQASHPLNIANLPGLKTLLGLHVGSLDELLKYVYKSCARLCPKSRHRRHASPMSLPVRLVALAAIFCLGIIILTWTADTLFHSFSNSVVIERFDTLATAVHSFGYTQTQACQHFNRSKNQCLPCTDDISGNTSVLEYNIISNEIFRLKTNVSEISQIQPVASNLSILLPRTERISNQTDYRAQTLGVSASCRPITNLCNLQRLDVQTYTMFNCSPEFRGILGQAPVFPPSQYFTILDPDTPALDFKPSAYLQYGFYQDSKLSIPYNSVNWNFSSNDWAILAGAASTLPCPTDEDLPSTVHMGVAGRFDVFSAKAGVNLFDDPGLVSTTTYSAFVFECALQAHYVDYVWASQGIRNYTTTLAESSLLNMYIGQLPYYQQSASDDMTSDILQMALNPNSQSMADAWAQLFTVHVLSVIGGYSAPALNLQEQTRNQILVARVNIGSLWFLVGCNIGIFLFVSWVALRGVWIVRANPDILALAARLNFSDLIEQLRGGEEEEEEEEEDGVSGHYESHGEDKVDAAGVADPEARNAPTRPQRSSTGTSYATTLVPTATDTVASASDTN